jgi:maleylacetoacetate isomerase
MLKLLSYYRSSSSYRVRIGLNLKGLPYSVVPVHLLNDGGEQHRPQFIKVNPSAQVPVLQDGSFSLAQSMAIILYLEDAFPKSPALFSKDSKVRAQQIALCELVNSGIQPLHNLRVLNQLKETFGASEEQTKAWCAHWISLGLASVEKFLSEGSTSATYAFGDEPSAVDCFLIPQLFAAARFGVSTESYPSITRIAKACEKLDAFSKAHPSRQVDTV